MEPIYTIFPENAISMYNMGMIGHLTGQIIYQDVKSVILDVAGVGYKIYTPTAFLSSSLPKEASFWTYMAVRENAIDLYGFPTREELDFFELLLCVSGIGPKSALGILSVATIPNLRQAILTGDTAHLTKVSGIGKKNAEKIVLELKDKIQPTSFGVEISADVDAILALESLGYSERDAREALKKVSGTNDTGEKVRQALKILS